MSLAELIMLAYWLAAGGMLVVAIAFALWFSGLSHRPAVHISLDCLSGLHGACHASGACQDCHCHIVEAAS